MKKEQLTETQIKNLKKLFRKTKQQKVHIEVTKVNKQGTARYIKVLTCHNGYIEDVSLDIATLLELKHDVSLGVQVKGCGMNMACHLMYKLVNRLYLKATRNKINELLRNINM